MRRRHLAQLFSASMAAALLLGCTASTSDDSRVSVTLPPGPVLADDPLDLTISGLEPGTQVEVAVRGTVDQAPVGAQFAADDTGTVDLAEDAPVEGSSYGAASGYGLLWQLDAGAAVGEIEVSVSVDGQMVDTLTQRRALVSENVRSRNLRPGLDGLSGRYYFPAGAVDPQPAVVVFGGSEGGLSTTEEAQLLASRGYPALALAYFDAPGLPQQLRRIRLEYFANALAWLSLRPEVDPDRVVPYGISRGSEAALLVASLKPELAAGVIAFAPNGVAVSDAVDGSQPAWTWQRRPVPWAKTLRQWWSDPGAAVIDVWDIDGPLLLVCGKVDQVWSSCSQTDDIVDELEARDEAPPTVLAFDGVGHEIGYAVPGTGGAGPGAGEDLEATGLARAEVWQGVLDYLDTL